jgi:superfamily II DNA/RNA helicase
MNNVSFNTAPLLANLKIKELNEMQQAVIAAAHTQNELIVLANTGTGKTLAFLLPVLEHLNPELKHTQALIMAPSRELALQIEDVFKKMGTSYKVTCCYGGHKREIEENNLVEAPALIIGTAGRLADHIRRDNIKTAGITTLVLDEFDKSLELGFLEEMAFITGSLKQLSKKILTSATQAVAIPAFLELKEPHTLNFLTPDAEPTINSLAVKQVLSDDRDKLPTLFRLLCKINNKPTIVFCNHRDAVERTNTILKEKGIYSVFYHGGMEQREREAALCKFRNGTSTILVTTDLASRGLDIPGIRYVIHFHLPASEDVFTHRNGRTARMEEFGTAILIVADDETLPKYINPEPETMVLPATETLPDKPKWTTLFIAAGKKNKVNKIDIVGFLSNHGNLKKDDIGLVEIKDFFSFAAVQKNKVSNVLELIKGQKLKNQKIKIAVAK